MHQHLILKRGGAGYVFHKRNLWKALANHNGLSNLGQLVKNPKQGRGTRRIEDTERIATDGFGVAERTKRPLRFSMK